MNTNLQTIQEVVDYIDAHLGGPLDLDHICRAAGYSKYHLSRMFSSIVACSMHSYVRRRRLTEAARLLVFTDKPILDIALFAGYETQQSFTTGFKSVFRCSPQAYRKKRAFHPLQLKFSVDGIHTLRGDNMMQIRTETCGEIRLVGCHKNTRWGFFVIGQCWRRMHAKKHLIEHRIHTDFLIGLNDYSRWEMDADRQPAFDYFAAAQVAQIGAVPGGMEAKTLPASKYIVFQYQARREDSLQPVADYVYKVWFPQSTCQLNEHARYDFARYGETVGADGTSPIEFWVPIL